MKHHFFVLLCVLVLSACASPESKVTPSRPAASNAPAVTLGPAVPPSAYVWFEPEWFEEVTGRFAYWPGPGSAKATGSWGIAGPGISAEWTQGGESGWNSMGVAAEETRAMCHRDFIVPRAGKYKIWVRYVDHRDANSPFKVSLEQGGKPVITGELGAQHVVPPNDEYELYWGFSFGWGGLEGDLAAGPATLRLIIDRVGEAWRQVDAVLITDDLAYTPVGREKPPFAYFRSFAMQPASGAAWRGSAKSLPIGSTWQQKQIAGRDFSMWTGIGTDVKWWTAQNPDTTSLYDVFFQFSPPTDIKAAFQKQYEGRKDVALISWPHLLPGLYLGQVPDLSPETNLYKWLLRTKTPFYIMTNYANPKYTEQSGPATYAALAGPLAAQFMGYIHGEAIGTLGVGTAATTPAASRRQHVDEFTRRVEAEQAEQWSKFYKTSVPAAHRAKSIPCLSCDSIAFAHQFHEAGSEVVGYEEDSTNVHVPMRIAFERGAARQYGGAWINYASSNNGDACNTFAQDPIGPRGAKSWFHSKYAITDGVSSAWYRRLYYLNYLSGASAIHWEQSLANQWILPGPGKHPIEFTPFGRATQEFQAFVSRLPERGVPYTPIAFLLSYGNGFEYVNYECKMLGVFPESANDRELRELFNVAWYPSPELEGRPQAPDVQSMPSSVYGNIFDVLVDRPTRADAVMGYPIVWAAGDVDLNDAWMPKLKQYLASGGTLVINVEAARGKPIAELLGLKLSGQQARFESWNPDRQPVVATTPYMVEKAELGSAAALAWAAPGVPLITRNAVGQGAVITTLVPHMLGIDERAHPALPFLMNGLTEGLLPVEVVMADGSKPAGQIMYQINRTKNGFVVGLLNNQGIDKTQNGVARVDRRQAVEVIVRTKRSVKSATEFTQLRDLATRRAGDFMEIPVRVEAGDVQVVGLVAE